MYAAENGHLDCVKILAPLEKGMTNYGDTAMMKAAENGHLECVKILTPLEKGMKNILGYSAKKYASIHDKKDCYDYLSQFPEECWCKDLFEAVENGCEKCC